jgi:hypothetical protein
MPALKFFVMKNFTRIALFIFLMIFSNIPLRAQVGINTDGSFPDSSAMLDVKSTTRGMLIPRLTTAQRTGISDPAAGLLVYDLTLQVPVYFDGVNWCRLDGSALSSEFPGGAVFVSPDGTDIVTGGSMDSPFLTISYAIVHAVQSGSEDVFVANGTYHETIDMVNGVNLYGGYDAISWKRNAGATQTIIRGTGTINSHPVTIKAISITSRTVLEGFVVYGMNCIVAGHNSYAIYINPATSLLEISGNVIFAGNGAPGDDGINGQDGAAGIDGTGRDSNPSAYDAFITTSYPCNSSSNRQYSNGGVLFAGTDNISGGNGGGNQCPPVFGSESSGIDGFNGQPGDGGAAGVGGDAGDDGKLQSGLCYLPTYQTYGLDGSDGADAPNGPSGTGGGNVAGGIVSGHWVSSAGTDGTKGNNGGGGGGGGAGGGGDCVSGCTGDRLGGHGGGGSGGGGGFGGGKASGGGGSFGIFILNGNAPVIENNIIYLGNGGRGGQGGNGGVRGDGGEGGNGGLCVTTCFCNWYAGHGGHGGNGGFGGGGGGGCGGNAIGIYTNGVSGSLNYGTENDFSGGIPGPGGNGGASLGNDGTSGSAGTVVNVTDY